MLTIYRSNRIERLADSLTAILRHPPGSPLEKEWVVVQNQGIANWLSLIMADQLGIWANVAMPFPRAFWEVLLKRIYPDALDGLSRFKEDSLTWLIMKILPGLCNIPEFHSIKGYLENDWKGKKLFILSRKLASVFDDYIVYRPEMLLSWERNNERLWQPILWKRIVEITGKTHLARYTQQLQHDIERDAVDVNTLPKGVTLFAISMLPPLHVNLLSLFSQLLDINLLMINPSMEFWAYITSIRGEIRRLRNEQQDLESIQEKLYFEIGNPLLASMGKMNRDFNHLIEEMIDYHESDEHLYSEPMLERGKSLLTCLQSDMLQLHYRLRRAGHDAGFISDDDKSVSIHCCHSKLREVEVVRDQLLLLFQEDKTLQLHEVCVLMPDIAEYAPIIRAIFDVNEEQDAYIPYLINFASDLFPVIDAFKAVLNLIKSRITVQEILDLISMEEVAKQFGFLPEDVLQIKEWLVNSNVRWGIDSEHRKSFGQPEYRENTWLFGLDRVLLGTAMIASEDRTFMDIQPYDEVEGNVTELLGNFVHFCELLFDRVRRFSAERSMESWREELLSLLELLIFNDRSNEYQHQLVRSIVTDAAKTAEENNYEEAISFDTLMKLLSEKLNTLVAASGHFSDRILFSSFSPMQSVPFRVILAMGLNDHTFPRVKKPDSFDLIAKTPRIGDSSPQNNDRGLFLEMLLMARERIILTYIGRDIHDNSRIPPSIVVNELLDIIAEGFNLANEPKNLSYDEHRAALRNRLVTTHPLHPYNPIYFDGTSSKFFSYSEGNCQGAAVLLKEKPQKGPFLETSIPYPYEEERVITISDLVRFYKNPIQYFLKKRLDMVLIDNPDEINPREPIELDSLESYSLGTFLLQKARTDKELGDYFTRLKSQGGLPLGEAGRSLYEKFDEEAYIVFDPVREIIAEEPLAPLGVDILVGDTRITGNISSLWPAGRLQHQYTKTKAKYIIELWINHLLLNAIFQEGQPQKSFLISREKPLIFSPVPELAMEILEDLVSIYWEGLLEPLRFMPESGFSYVKGLLKNVKKGMSLEEARDESKGPSICKDFSPYYESRSPYDIFDELAQEEISLVFSGVKDYISNPQLAAADIAIRIFSPLFQAIENKDDYGI